MTVYPTRLTPDTILSIESLTAFTKRDLMEYFELELEPMLAKCFIAGQPIFYQAPFKSHAKTVMIERIYKLQATILKYQAAEEVKPEATVEQAVEEAIATVQDEPEITAADIASVRDDLNRVRRELDTLEMGTPAWEAKKIRLFALSAQLQSMYDLEAGKTINSYLLPHHYSTEAAALRDGQREIARMTRRGAGTVRAWRLVTCTEQFNSWDALTGKTTGVGTAETYYRIEIDEVVDVTDLLDAND